MRFLMILRLCYANAFQPLRNRLIAAKTQLRIDGRGPGVSGSRSGGSILRFILLRRSPAKELLGSKAVASITCKPC